MNSLLLRADADSEIGAGHFMRSLALAQAAQKAKLNVSWVSHCPVEALRRRVEALGIEAAWLEKPTLGIEPIRKAKPDWTALDGYQFSLQDQKAIRASGSKLLLIDDHRHLESYDADAILNQNPGAEKLGYKINAECVVMTGTQYCLIREEFLKAKPRSKAERSPLKALLTMGGADPVNATQLLMKTLEIAKAEIEISVLLGAANPRKSELEEFARNAKSKFKVIDSVDDMPSLLSEMDLAISAAGATCWELCVLGLPMAVLSIAENQRIVAAGLERAGAAVALGDFESYCIQKASAALRNLAEDKAQRERLSEAASKLVDGLGAKRVLRSIFPELDI